ncbi:MAG: lysostaphin resistance A-like protein [Butyrivibrio sp.]
MKRESAGLWVWRMIYPILIFIGVDTFLTMIVMYGYMFKELAAMQFVIDADNIKILVERTMNFIYSNALYLTIIRSAVLIPIFYLFMRKDVKKDKLYGRYREYTPCNKAWMLILPVIGITAALGFNNLVMMIVSMLQEAINYILEMLTNGDYILDFFETFNESANTIYNGNIFVQIIATSVCAPLVEELLFRGVLYKRMRTRLKVVPSMLISSAIFGIIHGNLVQFIYAFLIGMILSFVYEKFKNIWAPIILHAGANLLSVLLTMLLGESTAEPSLGLYMIVTVVELAVTCLLLILIERKVNRQEITPKVEENN